MIVFPLPISFGLKWASAFTTAYSRRWGERGGRLAGTILRNVLGIPVWDLRLLLAFLEPSPPLSYPCADYTFHPPPATSLVV